jgi:hypothetical protein
MKVSLRTQEIEDAATTDARAYDYYLRARGFI